MGTFAHLFKTNDSIISIEKREELAERIEVLYQAGGMMVTERLQLCGVTFVVLRKVKMDKKGMSFNYNYFEDDFWEYAGFDRETSHVWSEKIGWGEFAKVVLAAYTLEEQYTEGGVCATLLDGIPVTLWGMVGWINYLFNDKRLVRNYDSWKLFEAMYNKEDDYLHDVSYFNFGKEGYAFLSRCEIYAVLNGSDKVFEVFDESGLKDRECIMLKSLHAMRDVVLKYAGNKTNKEESLQKLMDAIYSFYDSNSNIIKQNIELEEQIIELLEISDSPAFLIKVISEIYEKDFWELWSRVCCIVKRTSENVYGHSGWRVCPISTMDFLRLSADDMIPYWTETCDFKFSEELWEWFESLKKRYDELVSKGKLIDSPVQYIVNLIKDAEENYFHVFTFADFFEETLNHVTDIRYQAFWKLYEEMICDPELKKAGEVIFVSEEPEYEKRGVQYFDKGARRLKTFWNIMDLESKNNKGRITLRRYMALMANSELRTKVFGF